MNKKSLTWLAIIVFGIALCSAATVHAQTTYELSGTVYDGTGAKIPNVAITAYDAGTGIEAGSDTTDTEGFYSIFLEAGTYNLIVTPPVGTGFDESRIDGLVITEDTIQNIVLIPKAVQLSGTVMTSEGVAIPEAYVSLRPSSGTGIEYEDFTDENGYYEISLLAGIYDLEVGSWHCEDPEHIPCRFFYKLVEPHLFITENTERDIVVDVVKLSGIVTDANAVPVPNVGLEADWSGPSYGRATSGEDGRYIMALIPGTYDIYIYPPEGSGFAHEVIGELDIPVDTTLDIILQEAIQLTGTVTTSEGVAIPEAYVRLRPSSGTGLSYSDSTDENGYYEISLPAGIYDLYLSKYGSADPENIPSQFSQTIETSLSITENTERVIVVDVVKLSGIVTDINAVPVLDVYLYVDGPSEGRVTSGVDGRYIMALIPGTNYEVSIYPPEGSGFADASIPGMDIQTNVILVVILQQPDTVPPTITSGPTAIDITQTTASIQWLTDELSDSVVDYGLDTNLGTSVSDPSWVVNHMITLTDLAPGTTYYYRVSSTDRVGNGPTQSDIFSFTTLLEPDVYPPVIIFGPEVLPTITDVTATVHWITDEPSNSYVFFGKTQDLGNVEGSEIYISDHYIDLAGLEPDTIYYYKVASTDPSGNGPTESSIHTFRTKEGPDTEPPIITSGPTVLPTITDTAAQIVWTTDEISDSGVSYNDGTNYYVAHDDKYVIDHMMTLTGLQPDTLYYFTVSSKDPSGNGPTLSETLTFRTLATPDTDPPIIVTGPVAKSVTSNSAMIEWETDEISDGRVDYGLDTNLGSYIIHIEDLILHQLFLTNLKPTTTYYYKVSSTDPSSNGPTESEIFSFTTLGPPSEEFCIDFDPDTLNLQSKGKWVTTYIELPEGYDVSAINVSTVMLNDQVQAEMKPTEIGDYDDDSIPDLMVKFDRSAIQEILEVGDEVVITVTGELINGTPFEGSDTIRVIEKGGKK
ncbi:carboxypeptidase regulatory-like domain-containing protein [candidate division WOR-3 bacterium]|nr:carboxypeptidase regulatory-like domain-containing protein [candidate division WOR-3 bacterium]